MTHEPMWQKITHNLQCIKFISAWQHEPSGGIHCTDCMSSKNGKFLPLGKYAIHIYPTIWLFGWSIKYYHKKTKLMQCMYILVEVKVGYLVRKDRLHEQQKWQILAIRQICNTYLSDYMAFWSVDKILPQKNKVDAMYVYTSRS